MVERKAAVNRRLIEVILGDSWVVVAAQLDPIWLAMGIGSAHQATAGAIGFSTVVFGTAGDQSVNPAVGSICRAAMN